MKTILYIGDTYIATIEELQQILKANNSKKNKAFGKELLYFFNEGFLSDWLIEHGCFHIVNTLPQLEDLNKRTDNDILKSIYRSVLNNTECLIDLDSVFSEMASLIRCEVNGKEVPFQNDMVAKVRETDEVSFVFKALEFIEEEMSFVLKKVGYYSIAGDGFVMGDDIGKPHLSTKTRGNHSSGSEFTVSFGFQEWNQVQRQGKYLLKYVGGKSELLCELVYQPQQTTKETITLREFMFKGGLNKGGLRLPFVSLKADNSELLFIDDSSLLCAVDSFEKETGMLIVQRELKGGDRIEKVLENINKYTGRGLLRLVFDEELIAIIRWATFWDFDFGIFMGGYYAYRSRYDNAIKYCDIELNDVENPPFNFCFMVFEQLK